MRQNILVGLLTAGIGFAMIYFSQNLVEMFGRMERAEKNVGGTRKLFVLIGFGGIVLGFAFIFGLLDTQEVGNATESGFGTSLE